MFRAALTGMNAPRRQGLLELLGLLSRVANASERTLMGADNLGVVFGPVFLPVRLLLLLLLFVLNNK